MARLNYVAGMTLQQKDASGETNYYLFGETNFSGTNGTRFKIAPNFEVLEMNEITLKTKIICRVWCCSFRLYKRSSITKFIYLYQQ